MPLHKLLTIFDGQFWTVFKEEELRIQHYERRRVWTATQSFKIKTEKDPVAAYKLYVKKRPTEMNDSDAPFYLAVNNCRKQESSKAWFKKWAVGQN